MHYLEKITKIEFQSFKVKKDTKALSKIAKEVSRIQSMVTSYRVTRTKWAVFVQSSPCPYKVGRGLVCVENNYFSRQSGNDIQVCSFFFLEILHTLTKIIYWLAENNNTESKLEINK